LRTINGRFHSWPAQGKVIQYSADERINSSSVLPALNGLRGFSILLVMLSHASNRGIDLLPVLNFSGAGRYGVFLFFVLSAFLLTRQFLELKPQGDQLKVFLAHYFLRRLLRIYPLFLTALLVYYLLYAVGMPVFAIDGMMVLKSLMLMDARGMFWTVPVEFQYYFILPIVALLFVKLEQRPLIFLTAVICFTVIWTHFFPPAYSKHVLPFLPVFVIGSMAAYLYEYIAIPRSCIFKQRFCLRVINMLAMVSLLAFILLTPNYFNYFSAEHISRSYFHKQFIGWALLASSLVLLTLLGNGIVYRIMTSRFMLFWGKISFSAYLGHIIILTLLLNISVLTPTMRWLIFFPVSAVLFYLSYRYIERPLSKIDIVRTRL